jgi:hypothetical protein
MERKEFLCVFSLPAGTIHFDPIYLFFYFIVKAINRASIITGRQGEPASPYLDYQLVGRHCDCIGNDNAARHKRKNEHKNYISKDMQAIPLGSEAQHSNRGGSQDAGNGAYKPQCRSPGPSLSPPDTYLRYVSKQAGMAIALHASASNFDDINLRAAAKQ